MSEELNQPQGENQEVNSAEQQQDNPVETNQQPPVQPQQQIQQPVEKKPQEEQPDYSKVTEINEATEILEGKGINYDELQTEWDEKGELSEETYQKLEKAGITREIANSYIEGRKAIVERTWDDIASVVGGRDEMANIVNWAINNLSEEEKTIIEAERNPYIIKVLLKDLRQQMIDKEGYVPQTTITGDSGDTTGNYFRSMAEVEEAINDPKYAKDEVYRSDVARKITASREAGILELK